MREPDMLTSPRRNRLIRGVAVTSFVFSLYYLIWRVNSSFNPDALWLSLILWAAEAYGVMQLGLFLFTVWEPVWRRPKEAPPGLDVDVFITTYNESLEILRKTVVAAHNIRYPHRTWVLDDGCRDEVRALALQIGVGYIPREESEHAKAGNLNTAIALTSGDFFLQLDADHVPLPHILDRLLGYFDDPKVAFVQSPQDFYNLDSFTHVVDDNGRRLWEEQRIFFDVIQPGKDRWNASFFCGSCGVIRRAALEEIGGFSTQTVTEDMETSLLLHARGWKSAYVTESLAYGLSPGSMEAYAVQRLRWATGSMQVLRKLKPLFHRGLTWPQRLCYFDSCIGYFSGLQMAILVAVPFLYFLTGILPIRTVEFDFLVRFFPFIFLQILTFELAARGRGYLWLGQRYTMVRFPIYTRAIATFFVNRPLPFVVTPKGADRTPVRTYKWQLLMVVATPLALIWATVAYARGWVDYGAAGWRSGAFVLNGIWMLWTAAYALRVVKMAREMRQHDEYRFRDELPIRIFGVGRTGVEGAPALGLTKEVSTSYLSFLSVAPISPSERVQVMLPLITGEREITTEVLTRREVKRGEAVFWEHRCRNEDVDLETQFAIEQHCLHHAVPGRRKRYSSRPDLFEDLRRFLREQRRTARNAVRLPAQVRLYAEGKPGRWRSAVIEELDTNGAQLMLDADPPIGSRIDFQVPGVELNGCGRVVHVAAVETPLARRWIVGLRHGEIHVENPDAVPLAPLPEPALEVVATIATELEQPALPVTVDGLPPGSPLPIEPEVGAGDEPEGMARLVS